MNTRLFYTTGKRDIIEEEWDKPDPTADEIEVRSIFTGVCRSDIDMYLGNFQTLPKHIQGHESLGVVTKVGDNITDVKEGDYVATRGEPAFADYYNCKDEMFVKVPVVDPKYIIEPVACGINIAMNMEVVSTSDIVILGSGFLATIIYTMLNKHYRSKVIVVGSANTDFWKDKKNVQQVGADYLVGKKFDYVIDVSEKAEYVNMDMYNPNCTIVMAAEKHPVAQTSFSQFLWNAVTIKFPSPRNNTFHYAMSTAVDYIEEGIIDVSSLWTKSYKRDTEVKLAFEEGIARPCGYSRGYIAW